MAETKQGSGIDIFYGGGVKIPPDPKFAERANATAELYERAERDFVAYWESEARRLVWFEPWQKVLEGEPPDYKWFVGGKLNVSFNCLDRHVAEGRGAKVAYHWEGEPGDARTITYQELLEEVCRTANALKELGVKRGDRVAIYMPMIPELPIAMLACTRIGAAHTVVFGGFSGEALRGRIQDATAKLVITADGGNRRGAPAALKPAVDEALADGACPSIEKVLVARRTGQETTMEAGRDVWWDDVVPGQSPECEPEQMDAEDLLYILYTSGTTAKPKGIVHTTGGYLVGAASTHHYVFDIKPRDVYWCAADVGWVTGHTYIVYGPLTNGATSVMYEGTPDTPNKDRWWDIVERYKVNILYCAPTAIRTFMKWGEEWPEKHDLASIRLLGTVGEPINPEAWLWYRKHIGGDRVPVVDTWWQTETGSIMISPLPGVSTLKPGSAGRPLPGISAAVVDDGGNVVGPGGGGYLVLDRPWPAMLRGIYGDHDRYVETYWSRYPGKYFVGDGCKIDEDGDFWLLGRVDDVMNVSGHRISTIEIESALVDHPSVAEAAVVGATDATTGQAIVGYVILRVGFEPSEAAGEELRNHVAKLISPIAKPRQIHFTPELPKTRSGKIMRRLLRDVAEERALGDTTTLTDPGVVDALRAGAGKGED
ncbi:MAG TPA: acetate--CoA ligase [Candidatus Dormibacteraeota bacterium]|nr:acetate--CoA ligase [Candidatus Dormibacteraeota bacterium]